jgi:ApbE superfamily uncharacterized protein (UPF0280 family)
MIADRPRARELSGGRLHLSHGPIEVVLRAWGTPAAIAAAYRGAATRFPDILPELCRELPRLRAPIGTGEMPESPVGRRMAAACRPFADVFLTPMAAVAGSVADELMAVMLGAAELERAYVNDGGDIAVHCVPGAALDIGVAGWFGDGPMPALNGAVRIRRGDGIGGIATSGARGRSFSLGIADSVTVLAADAATADAAATLIANAVDIDHPAVRRQPASALDPDSDLGERPVTVAVGALPRAAVLAALEAGRRRAADYRARGLIVDAVLMLQGEAATLSAGDDAQPLPQAGWDSPPRRAEGAPLACGEGLGVGTSPFEIWDFPPPCPSPARGEGTLRPTPRPVSTANAFPNSQEAAPRPARNAGRAATGGMSP